MNLEKAYFVVLCCIIILKSAVQKTYNIVNVFWNLSDTSIVDRKQDGVDEYWGYL